MAPIILLLGPFAATYYAGRRSLVAGLGVLFSVGYAYGVIRANRMDGYSHLLFDAALLGIYASEFQRRFSQEERFRLDEVRTWLYVMIGWPIILFLAPTQDVLVELVGLRGNVFMLPCLLIGARLRRAEVLKLAQWLAILNIGAGAFAAVQYVVGIELFFPRNAVTDLIYRSGDIAGFTAYRIPSSFANAHAFAGTMVGSLPMLIGAWMQPLDQRRRILLSVAIAITVLSVFATGARIPVVLLFALGLVLVFSSQVKLVHKVRWMILAVVVAYVVSGEERLQRFLTLRDSAYVTERIAGSVNLGFLDVATQYPLGNGLGGGGTSIPYFLQDRVRNVVAIENEYARILLEQGIPGLLIWLGFLAWVFTRSTNRLGQPWFLSRRLGWTWCAGAFATGVLGTGLLTSIPATALLLLTLGWIAVPESAEDLHAPAGYAPAVAPYAQTT
ncbi:MAG: O-antigen ligase family protein [Acidobacteriota bacterium]